LSNSRTVSKTQAIAARNSHPVTGGFGVVLGGGGVVVFGGFLVDVAGVVVGKIPPDGNVIWVVVEPAPGVVVKSGMVGKVWHNSGSISQRESI
jgi:hypothetical protein